MNRYLAKLKRRYSDETNNGKKAIDEEEMTARLKKAFEEKDPVSKDPQAEEIQSDVNNESEDETVIEKENTNKS